MEQPDAILERPLPPGTSYEAALDLIERGNSRAAIAVMRRRTVYVPWDPRPHGWLVTLYAAVYLDGGDSGHLRAALGAAEPAIEALREMVDDDEPSEERELLVTVHSSRGMLHWVMGRLEAAADDMEQALFLDPDDEDVARFLGQIYAELGRQVAA
jgi:tetratricopeptide (TPR) repeat protein